MNEIATRIKEINRKDGGAFIPYLMAGDPTLERSLDYIRALAAGGADLIELGVPFSDPVADGPTIQAAGTRALKTTDRLEVVFELVEKVREEIEVPLVLMSYYNPVLQLGETKFLEKCREKGIDGVILPDLPPEDGNEFIQSAVEASVATPLLATPGTDKKRLTELAEKATGFLYLVSRPGTTGAKSGIGKITTEAIKSIKTRVPDELPVCVGFGLSTPKGVERVIRAGADGAIVGSAIVSRVGNGDKPEEIERFVAELNEGTKL
ncbi:tryptophan synthase subunit alpha [Candidatus Bipolaricaulota bacterium]|nr:tryptophan synthase subunit alpha [Candidatus Bipolaricaulota bacterium]